MYQKTILENGIRVVTDAMRAVRSVAVGFLVDAGPRHEPAGKSGIAHLVEHLLFQGTGNRNADEIARLMDTAGGRVGAFTSRDYTCYYATVLDDYRTYLLDLFGDVFLNSIFPQQRLEREKEAILREIGASNDVPEERLNAYLKGHAWKDHPLGRSVAGFPETVRGLTREDAIYFFHELYLPDRLIVAAAGNVEHEDFVAHVRDAFWRMIGESPPKRYIPPPVHQEGATVGKMPVSQAYFALGLPCFPFTHSGRYMVHILNKILGGGLSSRLYRLLREEHGLVYQIATEYHAYGQAGMLVVEGSTAPDYLQKVLALTLNALARISADEKPICEEELWKAKMQIHGQHLLESEHSHTRMSRLATQELYFSQHFSTDDILAEIESLTLDRMRPFSRQFFTEALPLATLAVIGPDAHNQVDQTVLDAWLHDFKTSPKKML